MGCVGCVGCSSVSDTAQVELNSERGSVIPCRGALHAAPVEHLLVAALRRHAVVLRVRWRAVERHGSRQGGGAPLIGRVARCCGRDGGGPASQRFGAEDKNRQLRK